MNDPHAEIERNKLFAAMLTLVAGGIGVAFAFIGWLPDPSHRIPVIIAGSLIVIGSLVWIWRILRRSAITRGDAAEESIWQILIHFFSW